ncbi:MAG TPA: HEAT repeat domain-containing protein [Blastocatellia bacterium]|nr:HEAT repeat domain-containing protein [Blastocatellia bacterium]
MNSIRCRACGAANDLTAISCARCGASLVDETSDRWGVAQERIAARGALVEERTERRRSRLIVIGTVLAVAAVLVGGYYTHDTLQRNYYLMGEPLYDNQPAAYWTVLLKSDDHYLRRRGAQALDSLADKVNAATAKTIIPDLTEALNDEDEVVRLRAASALEKIRRGTGEGG